MKKITLSKGIVAVVSCLLVGIVSGFATHSSIETWYPTLIKPFFNPPNWLFAPVWIVLYVLLGLSVAIIWSRPGKSRNSKLQQKNAITIFVVQMILNALWPFLFFGLCNPFLAFIEIILLWLLIFETIKVFKKLDIEAGKLLYPYLIWVSFALVLNGSIWYLNI
ncbi:tryptophan-rich sensory protein [Flavobacterium amniphilum]|uniref:TspO/MBR family protein n=1 Tax=Flavobacterium amniphilum TaxID=1834035 RepID=UPI00202A944C|nr:TspO/MBR family protein [Flavobacterium amniphilum]MCL9806507.1 tryptophan-rich sensory protein [Flavobacterium amniphilum]